MKVNVIDWLRKYFKRYSAPVKYFEGNLIFTQGRKDFSNISGKECWAVYYIGGVTYDFLGLDEKISCAIKNARGLQQVYSDAQVIEIPVRSKVSDNCNYLRGMASGELKPVALENIDDAEYLLTGESSEESNEYDKYFVVKLKKPRTLKDLKDFFIGLVREPVRALNELLALDVTEIFQNEFEAYKRLERSLRTALQRQINIREVTEVEIEKVIRDPFWRALPFPKLRSKEQSYDPIRKRFMKGLPWKPECTKIVLDNGDIVFRPWRRDIATLYEGYKKNKLTHIEITQQVKGEPITIYQKFIVISWLPDIKFPTGREWIYRLNELGFPIWKSIRYKKTDYEVVSSEINKKRKELDDQLEHNREVGAKIPQKYQEQDEDIDHAKYEVEGEKKPFLYTTCVFAVAADTLQECNDRAKAVQDFFDDLDIETQIPTGEQWNLFNEMLIGSKQYAADYIRRLPPETLAGSMMLATQMIGDLLGIYIGTTGSIEKPVKFDPRRPSQINKSPSCTFTGTLGRGKSMLVKLIIYWAVLLAAKVFFVDPKDENSNWAEDLPELKAFFNLIKLSTSKTDTGKLDIFRVFIKSLGPGATREQIREITKKAAETALSIIGTILGCSSTDEKMEYIEDAVNLVAQDDNPCMMKIIETLEVLAAKSIKNNSVNNAETYDRLAKTLRNKISTTMYGHVLFGNGTEEAIDITRPLNMLVTKNLILPDKNKSEEKYNAKERMGMAILIAVSSIGMEFAMQSRDQLKIYVQDEASVLKRSAEGQAMFNRLVKMGRTENAPIYLIGQNISDIGEDDVSANVGTRFCFGTETHKEAAEILKYIGLDENSKELQDMLVKFDTGICLMRDVEGRISVISVDPLFEKLVKAFDTKPPANVQEEPVKIADEYQNYVDSKEPDIIESTRDEDRLEEEASDEVDEGIQFEEVSSTELHETNHDVNDVLKEWG